MNQIKKIIILLILLCTASYALAQAQTPVVKSLTKLDKCHKAMNIIAKRYSNYLMTQAAQSICYKLKKPAYIHKDVNGNIIMFCADNDDRNWDVTKQGGYKIFSDETGSIINVDFYKPLYSDKEKKDLYDNYISGARSEIEWDLDNDYNYVMTENYITVDNGETYMILFSFIENDAEKNVHAFNAYAGRNNDRINGLRTKDIKSEGAYRQIIKTSEANN